MLTIVLGAAAFVAGLAGAWSPCGFSVVETIGACRLPMLRAASCVAFTAGALAGAIATFAGLSALGGVVAVGPAVAAAVAVSLLAAAAEACGVRIVPQVRRQVPESWRRRLPLPAAAGAYGVLLGLGFVTFVLTLAFWALAVVALVLGQVRLGLALGVGFGLGRAVPILFLAPLASQARGRELLDAMAMRPLMLRGLRALAGAGLAACAGALLAGGASAAFTPIEGTDPSAEFGVLAWDRPGGSILRYSIGALGGAAAAHHTGPLHAPLPGRNAAVGDGLVAWRVGTVVRVVDRRGFTPLLEASLPGADELAVSTRWLVYRVTATGGDRLVARSLFTGREQTIGSVEAPTRLGRPSVRVDLAVFHIASTRASRIVAVDLARGTRRVLRSSRTDQLTNPSVDGGNLVYVRASATAQKLVRGPLYRPSGDRVLLRAPPTARRDSGYEPGYSHHTRTERPGRSNALFWTTALAPGSAYLTLYPLRGSGSVHVVSVSLGAKRPPRPGGKQISVSAPSVPPVLLYTGSNPSLDVLFALGAGGTEEVVASASRLEDPAWSPDGTRVAFAGPDGLYVSALDGTAPVWIPRGRSADADPSWSPAGGTIAFVRSGSIYSVGENGSGLRRLTSPAVRSQEPAWSPDGARLAYASRRRGNWDIYVVDAAGRERRITRTQAAEGYPSWSPDGTRLAFDRRTKNGWRIFVGPWGGGSATRLTSGPGDDIHPAWSPDGAHIAFTATRDGRPRIWRVPVAGGRAGAIARAPGIEDAAAWRPASGLR